MNSTMEPARNVVPMPSSGQPIVSGARAPSGLRRLLSVSEVATWLGVSEGWVRDHASGRRQPRLDAIKLGPSKGKGLWKFRMEDVDEFIRERRSR